MTKIYYTLKDGGIFEIRNWIREPGPRDCFIVRWLKEDDERKYQGLKYRGLSDEDIFFELNPHMKRMGEREIVGKLPKRQLIWLIEDGIGQKMKSLDRLPKRDLVKLFLALSK
jgi:hypothetical protein